LTDAIFDLPDAKFDAAGKKIADSGTEIQITSSTERRKTEHLHKRETKFWSEVTGKTDQTSEMTVDEMLKGVPGLSIWEADD